MSKPDIARYNNVAIVLHWSIALLIIGLLVLGWFLEDIPKGPLRKELFNLHKSLGLLVFVLVGFRVYWRSRSVLPEPKGTPAQATAAHIAHTLIYVLMALVPGIALIGGSLSRGIDFFQWHLEPLFAINKPLAHVLMEWHGWLAYSLAALVLGHVLAALWHHLHLRDGIFRRIWFG